MYENFVRTWETVRNREVSVLERCLHGEVRLYLLQKVSNLWPLNTGNAEKSIMFYEVVSSYILWFIYLQEKKTLLYAKQLTPLTPLSRIPLIYSIPMSCLVRSIWLLWLCVCIYIPHISLGSFMAVYNSSIGWNRTSACKGASGCCYQSIFELTHPPNPCMKCTMNNDTTDRPQHRELRPLLFSTSVWVL